MRHYHQLTLVSLVALSMLAGCGATRPAIDPSATESPQATARPRLATPEPRQPASVVELVDGDTLVLSVGGADIPVRLLSIDTPELDLNQCFAAAASSFVAAVAPPGAPLELERDETDVDVFGRLLRYVYLPDGSMLNEQLVRGGFARVTDDGADGKYLERLRDAEDAARRDGLGLWGECGTPTPTPVLAGPTETPTPAATAAIVTTPVPTAAATATPSPTLTATPSPTITPQPTATPTPVPTATATPAPTAAPTQAPTAVPTAAPPPPQNCDPSYPTVCIPPAPPDLDCGDISFRRFQVLPPDPHRFDGDKDGIGCES